MGETNNFRLIAAMPRSGSTLLLRQFNSCPDTLLMGESSRALIDLLNFARNSTTSRFYTKPDHRGDWDEIEARGRFPAWYNTFDEEEMRDQIVRLMQTWLNPLGNRYWGCKQITFGRGHDLMATLDALVEILPGAKVTILTRDIEAVEKSCESKFKRIPAYIYEQRKALLKSRDEKRSYLSHLEYGDLTNQDTMERYFKDQGIQTDSDKLAATIAKKVR